MCNVGTRTGAHGVLVKGGRRAAHLSWAGGSTPAVRAMVRASPWSRQGGASGAAARVTASARATQMQAVLSKASPTRPRMPSPKAVTSPAAAAGGRAQASPLVDRLVRDGRVVFSSPRARSAAAVAQAATEAAANHALPATKAACRARVVELLTTMALDAPNAAEFDRRVARARSILYEGADAVIPQSSDKKSGDPMENGGGLKLRRKRRVGRRRHDRRGRWRTRHSRNHGRRKRGRHDYDSSSSSGSSSETDEYDSSSETSESSDLSSVTDSGEEDDVVGEDAGGRAGAAFGAGAGVLVRSAQEKLEQAVQAIAKSKKGETKRKSKKKSSRKARGEAARAVESVVPETEDVDYSSPVQHVEDKEMVVDDVHKTASEDDQGEEEDDEDDEDDEGGAEVIDDESDSIDEEKEEEEQQQRQNSVEQPVLDGEGYEHETAVGETEHASKSVGAASDIGGRPYIEEPEDEEDGSGDDYNEKDEAIGGKRALDARRKRGPAKVSGVDWGGDDVDVTATSAGSSWASSAATTGSAWGPTTGSAATDVQDTNATNAWAPSTDAPATTNAWAPSGGSEIAGSSTWESTGGSGAGTSTWNTGVSAAGATVGEIKEEEEVEDAHHEERKSSAWGVTADTNVTSASSAWSNQSTASGTSAAVSAWGAPTSVEATRGDHGASAPWSAAATTTAAASEDNEGSEGKVSAWGASSETAANGSAWGASAPANAGTSVSASAWGAPVAVSGGDNPESKKSSVWSSVSNAATDSGGWGDDGGGWDTAGTASLQWGSCHQGTAEVPESERIASTERYETPSEEGSDDENAGKAGGRQ